MSPSDKTITLITGANAGIGFELAVQLCAKGTYHVLLGCRSAEKGNAALERLRLRYLPGTAEFIHLDMTDDATIHTAVAQVGRDHGHLDVLVNNAAIGRAGPDDLRAKMRECFDTNSTGPAILGYAFEELMKKSENPMKRIINVSSGAGSIGRMFDPNRRRFTEYGRTIHYQASKAALNMVSAQQADDFASHGVKVLCWNPGFTVSELGPFNKVENGAKPTDEAVWPLVEIIEGKRDGEANVFLSEDGKIYPW